MNVFSLADIALWQSCKRRYQYFRELLTDSIVDNTYLPSLLLDEMNTRELARVTAYVQAVMKKKLHEGT